MKKLPVIFIGHGSPMNAIEKNRFTESWREISGSFPKPKVILIFSAHWITDGRTQIGTSASPEMIYDMYGFPPELYMVQYNAPSSPEITAKIVDILGKGTVLQNPNRGYDHGVWSVLMRMYPEADIPVITMSLDYHKSPLGHYEFGKKISKLREEGVLIMASGNIVHNLGALDWNGMNTHPWAIDFDQRIAEGIKTRNHEDIINFLDWDMTELAHPSHDHLLPLFPVLGATDSSDMVEFYTPEIVMGSIYMRSIVWR